MYKNIINPKNGKLVDINSTLGKKILKKYLDLLLGHYTGGSEPGLRTAFEENNDKYYQFDHYITIEDADNDNKIGKVLDLGDLPLGAWFTYADGIIYKVIKYNGKIDKMICQKIGEEDKEYELDPFLLPVKYWGNIQNVPPIFKSGKEIRLDEDDEPIEFYPDNDSDILRQNIGKEINIGELPLKSWISYNNKLLQILHYDNFGELHPITRNKGMYCYKYGTNSDLLERIDSTDNAIYWGYFNNVPSELKER